MYMITKFVHVNQTNKSKPSIGKTLRVKIVYGCVPYYDSIVSITECTKINSTGV